MLIQTAGWTGLNPILTRISGPCNVMTRLGQNGDGLLGTAGLKHIEKRISNYLKATLPTEYDFKITGYPLMLIKSVDYIVYGQVQSLLLTLLVIFVVVLILLKDIRAALLSLIPMMVAVIINFGIMGWFGIHLDIATFHYCCHHHRYRCG